MLVVPMYLQASEHRDNCEVVSKIVLHLHLQQVGALRSALGSKLFRVVHMDNLVLLL
jgi:hypothetical protein